MDSLYTTLTGNPPATAFSAITASNNLQHLEIEGWSLPSGVWPYVFPPDRQLSLRHLRLTAPDGPEGLLLHVAQLKQLTHLHYTGVLNGITIARKYIQVHP